MSIWLDAIILLRGRMLAVVDRNSSEDKNILTRTSYYFIKSAITLAPSFGLMEESELGTDTEESIIESITAVQAAYSEFITMRKTMFSGPTDQGETDICVMASLLEWATFILSKDLPMAWLALDNLDRLGLRSVAETLDRLSPLDEDTEERKEGLE